MSSNIANLPTGKGQFALTPTTLDEAMRFADLLAKSSIVPKDYQGNPGNVLVAVQWGAEIGLAPMQAMQSIAVINGRPSIWGDAMLALVRGSGLLEYIREDIAEDRATCTVKRRGEEEVSRTYTNEDAKVAGLLGKPGPWQTARKRMLQMRARAFALRDVFTDVLRGVYIAEEAQDMVPEKDVTPEGETIAQPKSRADRTRQALTDRRNDVQRMPSPALSDVLSAINSASTPEALKAAADLAAHLDDDGKKQAGAAYKAKVKTEKARAAGATQAPQPEQAAAGTDTPAEAENGATAFSGPSYAEIAEAVMKAADSDALDAAADLVGEIADAGQRDELAQLIKAKREDLAQ